MFSLQDLISAVLGKGAQCFWTPRTIESSLGQQALCCAQPAGACVGRETLVGLGQESLLGQQIR